MQKTIKGFTLVEIIIVVVIAGIMLAMTFNLWWDYINFLRYKQDREKFVNLMDTAVITSRTTNYFDDVKYTYLDVTIGQNSLLVTYGTGDASLDGGTCIWSGSSSNETLFDSYTLEKATITWLTTPSTVRLFPFQIGCYAELVGVDICSGWTWLNIRIVSTVTDDETCYELNLSICKFTQVLCT